MVNSEIDEKKCTIFWNVDDLKILHIYPKVVDDIIKQLNQIYGKEDTLIVAMRGSMNTSI